MGPDAMYLEKMYLSFTRQLFLKYIAVIVVIFSTLICYRYWKYRRGFGSIPLLNGERLFCNIWLMGKIPKDVPFSSFLLYKAADALKDFEKAGICLVWFFQPILFVLNDEYTKIFSNERATADKAPFVYSILEEMLGKGLVITNGTLWKDRRKLLNPAFRLEMLRSNITIINKGANIIVEKMAKLCNSPTDEVTNILKLSSLKMLCGSMLGLDINSESYDSKMRRYLELLNILAEYTIYRLGRPWLYWRKTNLLFSTGRKHRKLYKEFHDFTKNLVMDMMASHTSRSPESSEKDSETCNDAKLFQILIEKYTKDPAFTLQDVQDEVSSIIFGGHDTTAYTLSWCMYMLGLHPEVQNKAFEEAESVIGSGTEYSYSDLNKLTYIECVIKETLRVFPAVPMFGRMINKDVKCGEYKISKGTIIGFSPYMLHRNPNYFPDPEKFDPERFSRNEVKPWTYIPFSEGMRSCIGKKYTTVAMKIVLAHILRNFEITSLDRREDIVLNWLILLTPLKPLRFLLTPRQSKFSLQE